MKLSRNSGTSQPARPVISPFDPATPPYRPYRLLAGATFRQRWAASWWSERVEWSDLPLSSLVKGNWLGVSRRERARGVTALGALGFFLMSQCVLPAAWVLSGVQAQEQRRVSAQKSPSTSTSKAPQVKKPRWAQLLEEKIAREKRDNAARLAGRELSDPMALSQPPAWSKQPVPAQAVLATKPVPGLTRDQVSAAAELNGASNEKSPLRLAQAKQTPRSVSPAKTVKLPIIGSRPGRGMQSAAPLCQECEVDVRALDLSKVPTERELRRAGQLGGALNPLRPAEPREMEGRLNAILQRSGLEEGLATKVRLNTPAAKVLERAQKKLKRNRDINLSFGRAIQAWNQHQFKTAAKMFEKHLEEYPESPWAGEAALHLGCDAKYNGRFAEAQERYSALLEKSSDQPNVEGQKKRPLKASSANEFRARVEQSVDRLMRQSASPIEAIEQSDDTTDLSFDIHQKAKMRWADLDLATGRFGDAAEKLRDIIATDTDWRRITWAQHWLRTTNFYRKKAPQLMACGPKSLGVVMAALGRHEDSARVAQAIAPRATGFSLAELAVLAQRNGTAMHGFRATVQELKTVPLPAILYYDYGSKTPSVNPSRSKTALAAKISRSKTSPSKTSPFQMAQQAGHFVVLHQVNAAAQTVRVFDALEKRYYTYSFAQLKRQWSGQGLELDAKNRLASNTLSPQDMQKAVGGCCGVPSKEDDLGCGPNNMLCKNGNGADDRGDPVVDVNRVTLNMYVHDTPLWYQTPRGPSVHITMSYNSQDSITQNQPFGNKWMFNYGSYAVEDTAAGGGRVTVFMPDGSKDNYTPNGLGGYSTEVGNYTRLQKPTADSYTLTFQDGSQWKYGIPPGTSSLQPFLLEMADPYGYKLTFTYDSNVHLTTITDAQGKVTTLTYDAAGHITSIWDPFGRHARFAYDANGNMVEAIDMEGHAFQYAYDSLVRIVQLNTAQGPWQFVHEGPDGNKTVYEYPPPGGDMWENIRLTMTNPAGDKEEFFYDGYHGQAWHVDHNNYRSYNESPNNRFNESGRSLYELTVVDGKGRIAKTHLPDETQPFQTYDAATGLPNQVTDARGKTTYLTYNGQGNVTSVTDPKGNVTTLGYAANGLDVTSVVNANNVTVATATYNAYHQPLTTTDRYGTTTYTYTAWGAPATVTDPQNHVTTYTYNNTFQLTNVAFEGVTQGGFTYDEVGRVKSVTDVANLTVSYEYNNLDAVTKVTYPDGTSSETDYVCCGLPGVVTDRSGRKSYTDYDVMKRPVRVQDAAGNQLGMKYDKEGNLERLVDTKGQSTYWSYDAQGRLKQKTYQDGSSEGYAYADGVLSQSRGARGQIVSYSYDDNGNLTGIDYPTMTDVAYSYNALNQVTSVSDGFGTNSHTWNYDGYGRLNSLDGPFANDAQSFSYNSYGRLQGQSVERGASGGTQSQSYAYDALERLSSLTSNGTQGSGVFTYHYVGNTDLLASLDLPNSTKVEQDYDALKRLTSVTNKTNAGANLASFLYSFDPAGQPQRDLRTSVTSQVGSDPVKQIAYGYDPTDQLTGEAATGGVTGSAYTNTFAYDAMGNRLSTQHAQGGNTTVTGSTANALNQLTNLSTTQNGTALGTSALGYDAGGNLTVTTNSDGSSRIYTYDDADRLVRTENKDAAGVFTGKSEFVYDYASRKVGSRDFTWTNGAWNQTDEKWRVYDNMDVVQERNTQNQVTAQYTRDGNIGGILARSSASGHSYFHYDGSGNVTALSDETGALVGCYAYDAFGNTLEASGARAAENPYRFSTKESIAGMVDFGYRFYSPSMGRWINRDPLQERGGRNIYGFVNNDPLNATDPNGLEPVYLRGQTAFGSLNVYQPSYWGRVGGTKTYIYGGTEAERRGVAWMVTRIMRTRHACGWRDIPINIDLVRKSGMGRESRGGKSRLGGSLVVLDLNDKGLPLYTADGAGDKLMATPLILLLAHELGHAATGIGDADRIVNGARIGGPGMANVDLNENPIRLELGFAPRTRYGYPATVHFNGRWHTW